MKRLPVDPYLIAMLLTVGLACILPAQGTGAVVLGYAVKVAIALLFFLYGTRLSPKAAREGLWHWRLHGIILAATYVLFPVIGLAAQVLVPHVLSPEIYIGLLFLCVLPSTVQSSIAFTSIARGNVPAALCAASASNILGVVVTPALVALLMRAQVGFQWNMLTDIAVQLLLPFLAGQLLRPWLGAFVQRHKVVLGYLDRGSILLVIYSGFSEGIVGGVWSRIGVEELVILGLACAALLAIVLVVTTLLSRTLGFSREDEIVIVFCGSKKSLASGLPMATVLFTGAQAGLMIIPLILYHQIQLMVCGVLARHYARQVDSTVPVPAPIPPAAR